MQRKGGCCKGSAAGSRPALRIRERERESERWK
jgi:hypothetical protein